jgi:hypothetical protein
MNFLLFQILRIFINNYSFVYSINLKAVNTKFGFFIESFSLKKNLKKLLSTKADQDISCIHGIRFFSMVWVVIGHSINWTDLNLLSTILLQIYLKKA